MPDVTVGRENTGDIRIYYEDHGAGAPVVLVHGYLADGHSWEKQETALLTAGYRVITYDRRGAGASSRPAAAGGQASPAAGPDGTGRDEFLRQLTADRPAAIKTYLDRYYNLDLLGGSLVSDQAWQNSFHTALRVSPAAALGGAAAWREDFVADVARITVPVLIVQGDQDRVMPPAATGSRLAVMLADPRLVVIPDGPHAIIWTHAAEVNRALLGFLRAL